MKLNAKLYDKWRMDAYAMKLTHEIEAIFADEHSGGMIQRRAIADTLSRCAYAS